MRYVVRGRVWVVWGRWWAVQVYWYPCASLGIHLDLGRPLVDLHLLIVTVALGTAAHITAQRDRHRHTCRGFLFADDPVL